MGAMLVSQFPISCTCTLELVPRIRNHLVFHWKRVTIVKNVGLPAVINQQDCVIQLLFVIHPPGSQAHRLDRNAPRREFFHLAGRVVIAIEPISGEWVPVVTNLRLVVEQINLGIDQPQRVEVVGHFAVSLQATAAGFTAHP